MQDSGSLLLALDALLLLGGENASGSSIDLALDCDLDGFLYCGRAGTCSLLSALVALLLLDTGAFAAVAHSNHQGPAGSSSPAVAQRIPSG